MTEDDEIKRSLDEWLKSLSPETTKQLSSLLIELIPFAERHALPIGFSSAHISKLDLTNIGEFESKAAPLIELLGWKVGINELVIENDRIVITPVALRWLKYIQNTISNNEEDVKYNPHLFYLSRQKGLYRVVGQKEQIYEMRGESIRFEMLRALTKKYQPTEKLAKAAGTTTDNFRGQIGEIRKEIEDHFPGVLGKEFIQVKQNLGYRVGDKFELRNK